MAAAFQLLAEPFAGVRLDVRLLAYSTVSQVGYLFVVVAVTGRSDLAVRALTVYLGGYAITNLGALAAVAVLAEARTIQEWAAAARRHRALVVCLLGLVGTPPTAVFVKKLAVFAAAWDGGFVWLLVLAAINTVASQSTAPGGLDGHRTRRAVRA